MRNNKHISIFRRGKIFSIFLMFTVFIMASMIIPCAAEIYASPFPQGDATDSMTLLDNVSFAEHLIAINRDYIDHEHWKSRIASFATIYDLSAITTSGYAESFCYYLESGEGVTTAADDIINNIIMACYDQMDLECIIEAVIYFRHCDHPIPVTAVGTELMNYSIPLLMLPILNLKMPQEILVTIV